MRFCKKPTPERVTVPLFGLPFLSSSLVLLINLHGEDVLTAMITEPDAVRHDLQVMNDLICELHHWYKVHAPFQQLQMRPAGRCAPRWTGQIAACSTHLVSARMYREFAADLDDAVLSVYERGGLMHLCGVHTQHVPVWREMKSLRAVQVNDRAAEDLETYFHDLRDDQIIYLNPTETMTVERALAITGGRRLVLVTDSLGGAGASAPPV